MDRSLPLLFASLVVCGCVNKRAGNGAGSPTATPTPAPVIAAQFASALAPVVQARVQSLLQQAAPGLQVLPPAMNADTLPAGSTLLAFGDVPAAKAVIPDATVAATGSEGFVVRAGDVGGVHVLATRGNAASPDPLGVGGNRGLSYGAYALLEKTGFAFLHPLQPIVPAPLAVPATLDDVEKPYWPERGIHLHTMHPLELTDMLQGWGPGGPDDASGWQARLPEWDRFLEWMLANRQNRVEWVLLAANDWSAFADSTERQKRLQTLVDRAHAWGIAAGADAPIAEAQQHTWRLVRTTGDIAAEVAQIDQHLGWLMGADYDFFSTEAGFSEFTAPDSTRMLAWMNTAAIHLDEQWHKPTTIKVHVSTGQVAQGFTDPDTGSPLNFNFLPIYADPRVGVMPHSVQMYSLDDPAPTYGNQDFSEMVRFTKMEAGTREVLWHPESAYWVSYDVDVPLFLPVYAERRLHDVQLLAAMEQAGELGRGANAGSRIQGQMLFSSGWEWGYWLNDVVAARAAWNPGVTFAQALDPVVAPFGPQAEAVRALLVQEAADQKSLLIDGAVGGVVPATNYKRTGIAYLEGWESWDDVDADLASIPGTPSIETQPEKLGLIGIRNPFHDGPDYATELSPLLAEMEDTFGSHADQMASLVAGAPDSSRPFLQELADASRMTALRAAQVHALYDVAGAGEASRLADAKAARQAAAGVVAAREASYRVDVPRIAGWRSGPTAYGYGYLWTAHSLHYWWRDEAKVVLQPASPCYLNIVSPVDVAFGEGPMLDLATGIADLANAIGLDAVSECLSAPASEPVYPPAGLTP